MTPATPRMLIRRCYNHAEREASARCVSCGRFFCRECVAEHAGRMICGACLRSTAQQGSAESSRWMTTTLQACRLVIALFVAWLVFYAAGRGLLTIPSAFHEGTVWRGEWWQEDAK